MTLRRILTGAVIAALVGCSSGPAVPKVDIPDGLDPAVFTTRDLVVGDGAAARPGQTVVVHYVGVLYDTGAIFESSWERNEPFTFRVGSGETIPGWDDGVTGMRVGGRRFLLLPPELAYGDNPNAPVPAGSTLVFVVDLLAIT